MNAGLVGLFGDYDDDDSPTRASITSPNFGLMSATGGYSAGDTSTSEKRSSDEDESVSFGGELITSNNGLNKNLPPEVERGNIEYKLKLVDPTPMRFEHLVTQMKWRLQEGFGEAIYEIGVSDDGYLKGLDAEEMEKSLATLKRMANRLGASMNIIRERIIEASDEDDDNDDGDDDEVKNNNKERDEIKMESQNDENRAPNRNAIERYDKQNDEKRRSTTKRRKKKTAAEVLIRRVPEDSQFIDIRIAVLGNVDSGKSTLISVLSYDELDNGQGRARLNLLRHIHEIQTGRTSSISKEIMGFNDAAEVQNFGNCRSAEEIFENSSKLISFIDLAGHSKYMKTTVFGLTGYAPDFTMLVINANNGIAGTTKEHLGFSMALEVRVFIVVNKIDMCSEVCLEKTLNTIEFLLKSPGCGKIPIRVNSDDDVILAAQNFNQPKICPIFTISCVKGTNLDKLKKFLHVLPPAMSKLDRENEIQQMPEFRADEIFFKKKSGHILGGMLHKGSIQEHEKLLLGPMEFGEFVPVEVQTIQRYRVPCRIVRAGQTAAVSIGNPENITEKLRKGMVLIHPKLEPKACREFEATIYLLFHANQIHKGFQATLHIGNVCQTASISYMDRDAIKTNEGAQVKWRFKSRPEYITVGSRLIFREGDTKGLGEVTKIYPLSQQDQETAQSSSPSPNSERIRHESGGSCGSSSGGGANGKKSERTNNSSPTDHHGKSKIQRTNNSSSIADNRTQLET